MSTELLLSLLLYAFFLATTALYGVLSWRRNYLLRNGVPQTFSVRALNVGGLARHAPPVGVSRTNQLLQVAHSKYVEHWIPFCGVGFRRWWQPVALNFGSNPEIYKLFSRDSANATLDDYWLLQQFYVPVGGATAAETKLTPEYMTDDMSKFVPQLWQKAELLAQALNSLLNESVDGHVQLIDLQQLCARYIVDVTAKCLFNVEHCDALGQPTAEFQPLYALMLELYRKHRQQDGSWLHWLPSTWQLYWLQHQLQMCVFTFCTQHLAAIAQRREQPRGLIGLLVELNVAPSANHSARQLNITKSTIKATTNVFLYFMHSLSHALPDMTLTLYELARHPQLQQELRDEIIANREQRNNFSQLDERECLEHVLCETQRAYCTLPRWLLRTIQRDYSVGNSNFAMKAAMKATLRKGTLLLNPIQLLCHATVLFPQPLVWDATRFAVIENMDAINRTLRRYCGRTEQTDLAELETCLGLMELLERFKFSIPEADDLQNALTYDATVPIVLLEGGPQLIVQRL